MLLSFIIFKTNLMKRLMLLVPLIALFQIHSYASGQGIWIYNDTDCDIAISLYAACPDENPCVEYSCLCSEYIPAGTSLINPSSLTSWLPLSGPTCTNWEWFKATIQIFCGPNHYFYDIGGGNANNFCQTPPRDAEHVPPPEGCCGNTSPIKMEMFYSVTGVIIRVHY